MMSKDKLEIGDLVMHSIDYGENDGSNYWGRGLGIIISFDEDLDPIVYFVETGTTARCFWAEITGVFDNDE
tara:strand:+ start:681 stop:893 length:213 start_codon:yes stop_codon:yes gene_type:complete